MALVKFGAGIVGMSGSIGGTVFSRNRYGAIARARVTPINPQTDRQSRIRAIIALVGNRWLTGATGANRAAWSNFAANVPATNKLGEVINLSGYNQFCKSNVASRNALGVEILPGPVIFDLPGEDPTFGASADAGTNLITVTFDDTRDWCDEDDAAMILQMGIPVNDTIEFFNGPWRHAGFIAGDGVAPPTSPDATVGVPFVIADGQKVFIRAKILRADGRLSDWFRDSSIVATA